MQTKKIISSI